jgi:hypothetical protein
MMSVLVSVLLTLGTWARSRASLPLDSSRRRSRASCHQGVGLSRLAPGVPLPSSRPRCVGSRRSSIQVTLAQGTTGDDATVGYRPSPTKNAARPTRIMRVMPTPSFRLASCASISAINDSDPDQSIGAEREAVRRTHWTRVTAGEAGGCLGTLPQTA